MKALSERIFELAESPRYIDGAVYFTDIDDKKLYRWKDDHLDMIWAKEQVTSFVADQSGGMVFATMQGLYRMRPDGSYYLLADDLKINDMGVDPMGRVVFGTNYHKLGRQFRLGSLYVYDPITGLKELDYGYQLSNGIGFSPDGKKMYVCDSIAKMVFVYDYDPETGECGRKQIFVRFPQEDGMPDGLAVDESGAIWTAQWGGHCVICTAPDGTERSRIQVPARNVSAVEFIPGGMFITCAREKGIPDQDMPGGIYFADPSVHGNSHGFSNIPIMKIREE